jgi:hypothetical protein
MAMTDPASDQQRLEALEDRMRQLECRVAATMSRRVPPYYLRVRSAVRAEARESRTSGAPSATSGMQL